MPPSPPLVSVIIPTYNQSALLVRAIRSVLAQSHPAVQLIVVDDGSSDDTPQRVAAFPQAQYLFQTNQGPAAARNLGFLHATGDLIASLDHDDFWDPGYLAHALRCFQSTRADIIWLNFREDGARQKPDFLHNDPFAQAVGFDPSAEWTLLENPAARALFSLHSPKSNSALLFHRPILPDGWDPDVRMADDWVAVLDATCQRSARCAFIPRPLWTKYYADANFSLSERGRLLFGVSDCALILRKHGPRLSPQGRRFFRHELTTIAAFAGYKRLGQRDLPGCLAYYWLSFRHQPSFRILWWTFCALLRTLLNLLTPPPRPK